jgi:hypothetical protein
MVFLMIYKKFKYADSGNKIKPYLRKMHYRVSRKLRRLSIIFKHNPKRQPIATTNRKLPLRVLLSVVQHQILQKRT